MAEPAWRERGGAGGGARGGGDVGALAAQRPDAFPPDLARSLSVLADCLEVAWQLEQALAADVEAVSALTPALISLPRAFAPLMDAIVCDYLRRSEEHGAESNHELVAPILAAFERLQVQQATPH